jgi:arginase
MTVCLLGLPTDRNSSYLRGPAKAPAAIRALMAEDMMGLTAASGLDIGDSEVLHDAGDAPLDGAPDEHAAIVEAARAAFEGGPALLLGGDHAVTYPILKGYVAAGRAPPHIVHIDAHPDLYPEYGGNPLSHASPFARVLEEELASGLTQIGIRASNPQLESQMRRFGVRAFAPQELEEAIAALPDGEVYISFDLDGLDPAYAPGVSHHEPGGLTVREALRVIEAIPGRVTGADLVEYNPDRDVNRMTAAVCVKLVKELAARLHQDG